MAIRKDNQVIEVSLYNIEDYKNKVDVRNFLLQTWITESPKCKYRYFVEKLEDGKKLYLERPGRLNKGCDFVIYIENAYVWSNGNDRPPNHDFVLNDLSEKGSKMNHKQWEALLNAVKIIYNLEPFKRTIEYSANLPRRGLSYEITLKLIRWFFNEQDLTYWSGQGRDMFFNAIINTMLGNE